MSSIFLCVSGSRSRITSEKEGVCGKVASRCCCCVPILETVAMGLRSVGLLLPKPPTHPKSEGEVLPIRLVSSINPLTEQVGNIIPSRRARISEVFGRFAAFLCQHSFVNFQTAGVNPSTSAEAGFGGLSPLDTMRMTVGSGLSGKGISPLYSYKDMSADNQTDEMQDNKPPRQPLRVRRCQIP